MIPYDYSSENGSILENCIQSILEIHIPSPKPDWVKSIIVPGQEVLQPKLNEINQSVEDLRSKAEQINSDIEQLEKWKYLLYEKGEHYLQPIVRNALSIIGFQDKTAIKPIAKRLILKPQKLCRNQRGVVFRPSQGNILLCRFST